MRLCGVAVGGCSLSRASLQVYWWADGVTLWTAPPAPKVGGIVLSWSFVDSDFGWLLVTGTSSVASLRANLYRTKDGGFTWAALGHPPSAPDQAFQANFSRLTTGWLTSASSGPYAYRTDDRGETWSRVLLPPPAGGWPGGGHFLVAVQPTSGSGALASVVYFPAVKGRTGIGADIDPFTPLVVPGFDGVPQHTYTYTTVIDQLVAGPLARESPPNQTALSTVDHGSSWSGIEPPDSSGAIGAFDASDWWWIGAGQSATSGDGGVTWTYPRNMGVVDALPATLRVLHHNHAWFAGSAG